MGSASRASPAGREADEGPGKTFLHSLTRPSGPSLLVSLGLCLAGLAACLFGITPASFVRLHPFFATERGDSDVFLSARALELAGKDTLAAPTMIFLGDSSLMSVVDPARVAELVSASTGRRVDAVSLMNLGQTLLATAALTDVLPQHFDGVLVVGTSLIEICRNVNPESDAEDPAVGVRFAFDSPTLAQHAARVGIELPAATGNYFWDHRRFFLPRIVAFLGNVVWRGPLRMNERPWQTLQQAKSLEERREIGVGIKRRTELGYPKYSEDGLRLLGGSLEQVHARGIDILMVETPLAPLIVDEFVGREFLDEHRARMRSFASSRGFEYVNLDEEAQLEDADFYDHTHVFREQAQQRFTAALARVLSERMHARGEDSGG